jgi:GTP-binding protein
MSHDTRNIAIIAHVDHGKTTLVDGLLHQAGAFREGAEVQERVMDSNDQERERGITILSKNTAVDWHGTRINIIDTPGHADFGSEVERVLKMVDGVLLVVDAAEGPMPQTRYVLEKSLALGIKALVCINKVDRDGARPDDALSEVFDLFVALEATDEQLDFPHIYAAGRDGWAARELEDERKNLTPLFEMIVAEVPAPPRDAGAPLQLQVATLDYSEFVGRICIGKVQRGTIKRGMQAVVCKQGSDELESFRVTKLMSFRGLERVDVDEVAAGDIVALAGAGSATVGDTICPVDRPEPMSPMTVDEPTVSMTFGANTSPFAGQEGKYVTSRQIKERLDREMISNVGLRIEEGTGKETFIVKGRGTLHLSVLIETMRREGFELSIGPPHVILKEENGVLCEPFEEVVLNCDEEYSGTVIQKLNQRGGELRDLRTDPDGQTRMTWTVPSRGLIGYRSHFVTDTRGTGNLYNVFSHYEKAKSRPRSRSNGVLISQDQGSTTAFALFNLQERGQMVVGPGVKVYPGQVVGIHARNNDLTVNPNKGKKLTNVRAAGSDDNVLLTPPRTFSLEEALEFIQDDELVEATPTSIRLRKRLLEENARKREDRASKRT